MLLLFWVVAVISIRYQRQLSSNKEAILISLTSSNKCVTISLEPYGGFPSLVDSNVFELFSFRISNDVTESNWPLFYVLFHAVSDTLKEYRKVDFL